MSNAVDTIKAIGDIISPPLLAWIALRQNRIHKQINGMQDKLITAEKSVSRQIGKKEGREDLKHEQEQEKN